MQAVDKDPSFSPLLRMELGIVVSGDLLRKRAAPCDERLIRDFVVVVSISCLFLLPVSICRVSCGQLWLDSVHEIAVHI